MKITILGGARYNPNKKCCQTALKLGNYFLQKNYVLYAGGGLGIMEAASRPYKDKPDLLFSICINGDENSDKCYHWNGYGKYIEVENIKAQTEVLTQEKDAIFIFPGGTGTLQELFHILSNKIYLHTKVFLIGKELKDLMFFCCLKFGKDIFTVEQNKLYYFDDFEEFKNKYRHLF